MTINQLRAFKRFNQLHTRHVRWWFSQQDYLSLLVAIVGAALVCAWLWS